MKRNNNDFWQHNTQSYVHSSLNGVKKPIYGLGSCVCCVFKNLFYAKDLGIY